MHRHMVAPLISLSVTALLICLVGALYGTSDDDTKNSHSSKRWAVWYSIQSHCKSTEQQSAPKLTPLSYFVKEESTSLENITTVRNQWNLSNQDSLRLGQPLFYKGRFFLPKLPCIVCFTTPEMRTPHLSGENLLSQWIKEAPL